MTEDFPHRLGGPAPASPWSPTPPPKQPRPEAPQEEEPPHPPTSGEFAPAEPPPPDPPAFLAAEPDPPKEPWSIKTQLIAGAVALSLFSGGIGGVVGAVATRTDAPAAPAVNALDTPRPAIDNASTTPAGSVQAVAQRVLPSVVMINVAGARAEGGGSGVILSSDGLILTNDHVASGGGQGAKLMVTFSDGSTAPARMVGADPVSDLAVIQAEGKTELAPIDLGSSADLQVGQPVVAVGSPLGLASTVTTGIVSALNRPVSAGGGGQDPNVPSAVIDAIQTDAAINPGNSGGALVDGQGRLIGINTAIATLGGSALGGQQSGSIGLGFAIPVDQARRVAKELIHTGQATYAQIGMSVRRDTGGFGAQVIQVIPGGPAAEAGIPDGIVVTKLDDRPIDSGDALVAAVRSHNPGDTVTLTYATSPDSPSKTTEVKLGAGEAER